VFGSQSLQHCQNHAVKQRFVDLQVFYVEDAAEGILLATECYNQRDPVNPSTGLRSSRGTAFESGIRNLFETIARLTGFGGRIAWDTIEPNSQPQCKLDESRAQKWFGFVSVMAFEVELPRTISWYRMAKTRCLH